MVNTVTLIGRLARDPEARYTQDGMCICTMTIAVDRQKKDDGADFIRIKVFGKQGENAERYLARGRQVAVQGRIQTGSYKNKDGQMVYTTDVIAERVEFLGGNNNNTPRQEPSGQMGFDDIPDGFSAVEADIPY